MSDGSKPEEKKEDNKDPETQKLNAEEEEEDEGYSCKACWNGYCSCVVWTCKCVYNTILAIKNGIVWCCASMWYPIKERCCNCCDSCDKKMNPYKDPYYNEYDSI